MHDINGTNVSGHTGKVDRKPDKCPFCHQGIDAQILTGSVIMESEDQPKRRLEVIYKCPLPSCQRVFIADNELAGEDNVPNEFRLVGVSPMTPQDPGVPEEVSKISATFIEVYKQSLAAKANQLDQLAGMGLRKALEFLIKDFCIHQHPGEVATIEKMQLGPCIDKYVDDANIKKCAKRAVWLGNDETHYVRKWVDKDITDLETLIRLTVNWIENILLTAKYEKDMP